MKFTIRKKLLIIHLNKKVDDFCLVIKVFLLGLFVKIEKLRLKNCKL